MNQVINLFKDNRQDIKDKVSQKETELGQRLKTNVSHKYATVESSQLIRRLEESFSDKLDFNKGSIRRGTGTTHHVTIPTKSRMKLKQVDDVIPNVSFTNSYNGECRLKVNIGFLRLVCLNGMVIGENIYSQSVKHVKGVKMSVFLDSFEGIIGQSLLDITDQLKQIDALTNHEIQSHQLFPTINQLVETNYMTKTAGDNVKGIYASGRFRRLEDWQQRHNIYGLWNVINEELRETRTKRTTDANLFVRNQKLLDGILSVLDVG